MDSRTDMGITEETPSAPARERRGDVIRLLPIRVLVVSRDRAFRAATATLLARRGSVAETAMGELDAAQLAAHERPDVVLYELNDPRADAAICARILSLTGPARAGLVLVGEPREAEQRAFAGALVLDRWAPFQELLAAIVEADLSRPAVARPPSGAVQRPHVV
jgi:CheY-like chemotaxis protein